MNYRGRKDRFAETISGGKVDDRVVSLRDVPLETRRREAKKPLFLVRYE
ncbi:MAG: hypothetical protein NWE98_02700 [Candidatus Bathyarchaeota archaeon]|nr:hypothetical protein [Candidatus Bathyarchaeota archaeon]